LKNGDRLTGADITRFNPNVAKAGGLQSQGVKGEAVVGYRDLLTTQDLKSSGFPSKNYSGYYDIGNNYELLAIFCHVVYATKGLSLATSSPHRKYYLI
jgi:hypothetical protein